MSRSTFLGGRTLPAGASHLRHGVAAACVVAAILCGVGVCAWAAANPLNTSRYDMLWAALYSLAFLGAAALSWPKRGRLLLVATLAVLCVWCSVVLLRVPLALLVLVWMLVLSWGVGGSVLDLLGPAGERPLAEQVVLGTSLGLGSLALLTFAMAACRMLYAPVAYGALVVLSALFIPRRVRRVAPVASARVQDLRAYWGEADLRTYAVAGASAVICLSGALMWAVAPSIHYDAMAYHLAVPAAYVRQHGMVPLTQQFRSYWAHNAEMLYTLGLLLVGQPLPGLLHLVFGLLAAGATYLLGRMVGGVRIGVFAAALFLATPIIGWEGETAYIDLVVAAYGLGAVYAAMAWVVEGEPHMLSVSGVLAGFALGTKLNAAFILAPLAVIALVGLVVRYGPSSLAVRGALRFAVPAVALLAPWCVRDWLWTGNPIFPFYNALFRSPLWPAENEFFNFAEFGVRRGLAGLAALPWDLTFHSQGFAEAAPQGLLGSLALLALPWRYLEGRGAIGRGWATSAMLFGVLLSGAALWYSVGPYLRYMLPLVGIMAVFAGLNIGLLRRGPSTRLASRAGAVQLACLLLFGVSGRWVQTVWNWQIPERYPVRLFVGRETARAFLSRAVPEYDAFVYLEGSGGPPHKVLAVGSECSLYTSSDVHWTQSSIDLMQAPAALRSPDALERFLREGGYDYVVIDWAQAQANPRMYSGVAVLDGAFLQSHARLEFARHDVYVYGFWASPPPAEGRRELLANGGFEALGPGGAPATWHTYGHPLYSVSGNSAHYGNGAVRATSVDGLFQLVPVKPGSLYTLSHWCRADGGGQFARLQVNWLDANRRLVDVSIKVVPAGASWERNEMSATAPEDAKFAQVYVSVYGSSVVWFDDLSLVEVLR